jgi:hypothetical protein
MTKDQFRLELICRLSADAISRYVNPDRETVEDAVANARRLAAIAVEQMERSLEFETRAGDLYYRVAKP